MRQPCQVFKGAYNQNCKDPGFQVGASRQLQVIGLGAVNKSGGAVDVGLGKKMVNAEWSFGTITAASTPDFTDVTTALQAGTAQTIFTTTNNDGFLVQSTQRFNIIGLNIAQAPSGGSPAYAYSYYNGSTMAALTPIASPSWATGTNLVVFMAPQDWVVGTTAAVGGDSSKYAIQVIASTAPNSVTGTADAVWVVQLFDYFYQVANNASVSFNFPDLEPLCLNGGESVVPYFGGTANAANQFMCKYRIGST